MNADKMRAAAVSTTPIYVSDVFSTNLYTSPSTSNNTRTLSPTNKLLPPEGADADWANVKRYLPLIASDSYDVVSNTYMGGNLNGGSSQSTPVGGVGVIPLEVDQDAIVATPAITGSNYNSSWCIEGWVNVAGDSLGSTGRAVIHGYDISGTAPANGILLYAESDSASVARVYFVVRRDSTIIVSTNALINWSAWVFVSASYDGSNLYLHADGVLKNTTAFTGWTTQPSGSVYTGCAAYLAPEGQAAGSLCQYRATFGSARAASRTTVPTRQFPITAGPSNCEDGLLWFKRRSSSQNHALISTKKLWGPSSDNINGFDAGGVGITPSSALLYSTRFQNTAGSLTYASWAFTKAEKFLDIVYYTGTGSNRTIAHSLGSVPGCILVKRLDSGTSWQVYHRSLANTEFLVLNANNAKATGATRWNSTTPTSTVFSLGTDSTVNASGSTYVAYLFAHDAGGFGASGASSAVVSGSYTGNGTTNQINCGFSSGSQFVMIKRADSTGDWYMYDTARGIVAGNEVYLLANTAAGDVGSTDYIDPYSPGFELSSTAPAALNANGGTFIYIAIPA